MPASPPDPCIGKQLPVAAHEGGSRGRCCCSCHSPCRIGSPIRGGSAGSASGGTSSALGSWREAAASANGIVGAGAEWATMFDMRRASIGCGGTLVWLDLLLLKRANESGGSCWERSCSESACSANGWATVFGMLLALAPEWCCCTSTLRPAGIKLDLELALRSSSESCCMATHFCNISTCWVWSIARKYPRRFSIRQQPWGVSCN